MPATTFIDLTNDNGDVRTVIMRTDNFSGNGSGRHLSRFIKERGLSICNIVQYNDTFYNAVDVGSHYWAIIRNPRSNFWEHHFPGE